MGRPGRGAHCFHHRGPGGAGRVNAAAASGGDRRLRVAFVTRALPAYRHPLYRKILRLDAFDFRIFCEDVDVNDPFR